MADSNNDTDVMILDIILKLAYKVSNRNETAVEPIKREAKKAKEAVAAEEEVPAAAEEEAPAAAEEEAPAAAEEETPAAAEEEVPAATEQEALKVKNELIEKTLREDIKNINFGEEIRLSQILSENLESTTIDDLKAKIALIKDISEKVKNSSVDEEAKKRFFREINSEDIKNFAKRLNETAKDKEEAPADKTRVKDVNAETKDENEVEVTNEAAAEEEAPAAAKEEAPADKLINIIYNNILFELNREFEELKNLTEKTEIKKNIENQQELNKKILEIIKNKLEELEKGAPERKIYSKLEEAFKSYSNNFNKLVEIYPPVDYQNTVRIKNSHPKEFEKLVRSIKNLINSRGFKKLVKKKV